VEALLGTCKELPASAVVDRKRATADEARRRVLDLRWRFRLLGRSAPSFSFCRRLQRVFHAGSFRMDGLASPNRLRAKQASATAGAAVVRKAPVLLWRCFFPEWEDEAKDTTDAAPLQLVLAPDMVRSYFQSPAFNLAGSNG